MNRARVTGSLPVVAIILVFFGIRLPLLIEPGIWFGWHADAGILGIMAKKIAEGRGFDFFFLGQNWIGPLTSLVAAAIGTLRALLGVEPHIGPVSLRLSSFLQICAGIVFIWLALKKSRSQAATLTAMFLAVGPPLLFPHPDTAFGPEMVWFMGGLLTWFGASELRGPAHALTFGVLSGITLWMNQGGVFYIAGVACALVRETDWWRSARTRLRIRDRLCFRGLPPRTRTLLLTLQFVVVADLAYLIIRDLAGAATLVPGFRWPYGEPIVLLLITHILASAARHESWFSGPERRALARYLSATILGFLVGYGPVILGSIFNWYPRLYKFGVRAAYPDEILKNLSNLFTLGFRVLYGSAAAAILALVLAATVRFRREWPGDRATVILLATAVANIAHWIFVYQSGKAHYLTAAIPGAWLIAAIGVLNLKRHQPWIAAAAALALFFSLALGASRQISRTLAEPDPRPVIATLTSSGCVVCYAEYWTAYKFRFLTNEAFRFIVYQSQDRTPQDSARYSRIPGKRCLILPDGTVMSMPRP